MAGARILIVGEKSPTNERLSETLSDLGYGSCSLYKPGICSGVISGLHPDLILWERGGWDRSLENAMEHFPSLYLLNRKNIPQTQANPLCRLWGIVRWPLEKPLFKIVLELALARFEQSRLLDKVKKNFGFQDESSRECELLTGPDDFCVYASPLVQEITDCPPSKFLSEKETIAKLVHEKDQKWLRQLFEKQKKDLKPFELKLRINSPKMRTIWVSLASQAILGSEEVFCGRRMLLRDITSQISEQRQKLNLRRIEALNLFNTGVSHYFGNLLQTVLAKAEMGLERLALDDPARDCLMQVKEVVFKGNALNQRMLAITGGAVAMEMPLNLKQLVGEMLPELNRRAGPNVELELDLDHQTPLIKADPRQFRTVLRELVANSAEALSQSQGRVVISSGGLNLSRQMLLNTYVDDNLAPGLYAYLRVMDNGPGMESQVLERAFDPFFSTKFINRGLGLAEILGVVRAHKGAVKLDSRPEFGCTATLFLPASKG